MTQCKFQSVLLPPPSGAATYAKVCEAYKAFSMPPPAGNAVDRVYGPKEFKRRLQASGLTFIERSANYGGIVGKRRWEISGDGVISSVVFFNVETYEFEGAITDPIVAGILKDTLSSIEARKMSEQIPIASVFRAMYVHLLKAYPSLLYVDKKGYRRLFSDRKTVAKFSKFLATVGVEPQVQDLPDVDLPFLAVASRITTMTLTDYGVKSNFVPFNQFTLFEMLEEE
jgi:hypothetical protein